MNVISPNLNFDSRFFKNAWGNNSVHLSPSFRHFIFWDELDLSSVPQVPVVHKDIFSWTDYQLCGHFGYQRGSHQSVFDGCWCHGRREFRTLLFNPCKSYWVTPVAVVFSALSAFLFSCTILFPETPLYHRDAWWMAISSVHRCDGFWLHSAMSVGVSWMTDLWMVAASSESSRKVSAL